MQSPYRLYGAELSPYSMKVRAYLTFKNIPFVWRARTQSNQDEFAAYAKLPLLPVLVDASEHVLQDSTPMIEALEAETGAPVLQPEDEALTFLSALVEDYADEWLNKAMFHYRWTGAA
ncbi:MAG: glutathione S-transferase N-terminal domain-containing protein, partial [Hyphomonadaceae bacterium]